MGIKAGNYRHYHSVRTHRQETRRPLITGHWGSNLDILEGAQQNLVKLHEAKL